MGQYYKPKKKPQNNQNKEENCQTTQSTSASNPEIEKAKYTTDIKGKPEKDEKNMEKWGGWKKTIRKTLQKQTNNEMKLGKLKVMVLKAFLKNNGGIETEAEPIFQEKIKNSRFHIKGDILKYIPKNLRLSQK